MIISTGGLYGLKDDKFMLSKISQNIKLRMKQIIYLLILLLSILAFGQQTYKVTEGELHSIYPGKGIIIKKDNQLFEMEFKIVFNKQQKSIETKVQPISEELLKKYAQDKPFVSYTDITEDYDFDKLKNLSFNYIKRSEDTKDYDEYKLCRVNNTFFAIFHNKYEKKNIYTDVDDFMPFIFIEFYNRKIIYTYRKEHIFIIPTKKSIQIFNLHDKYIPNYKTEKIKLTNAEIYKFSQETLYDLKDDFFIIDTLPTKKVQLKNIHNEILIAQPYDSISLQPIIQCYTNSLIDLYNLTFKKISKHPLKALSSHLGSTQILEKNKLKWIDWTGKTIKKREFFPRVLLPEAIQSEYEYELSISKTKEKFILKIRNFDYGKATEHTETDSLSLVNSIGIKQFYFQNNASKDTIRNYQEFYRIDELKFTIKDLVDFGHQKVYFLKEDGSFGMNYLGCFFKNENSANNYSGYKTFEDYQNLQAVIYKYPFYKMKSNNLYKFFSLQKDFRYTKLNNFQGGFARFKLPNGKKGWLDLKGNEYLDD